MLGVVALVVSSGCGGRQPAPKTAAEAEVEAPGVLERLPAGGFIYGRIDFDRLRESPYADRVVGWYREFVPAIPGFEAEHPAAALFEEVIARTSVFAVAGYAPADVYADSAETLGEEEGAVVLVRGELDLAFVRRWAERLEVELVERRHAGRTVLTTPDPMGEQLLVAEIDDGVLAFVMGRLEDAQTRLAAVVERDERGASDLAATQLADTAEAIELASTPAGVVVDLVAELREDLADELGPEVPVDPETVLEARTFGLRLDPSSGLLLETVVRMTGAEPANRLAEAVERMNERQRDHFLVLLLGFDLWFDHTVIQTEGDRVRGTIRVPDAELQTWLFHVEHLAAAAKAFLTDEERGLAGLLGGLGGSLGPPSIERQAVEVPDASSAQEAPDAGDGDSSDDESGSAEEAASDDETEPAEADEAERAGDDETEPAGDDDR